MWISIVFSVLCFSIWWEFILRLSLLNSITCSWCFCCCSCSFCCTCARWDCQAKKGIMHLDNVNRFWMFNLIFIQSYNYFVWNKLPKEAFQFKGIIPNDTKSNRIYSNPVKCYVFSFSALEYRNIHPNVNSITQLSLVWVDFVKVIGEYDYL